MGEIELYSRTGEVTPISQYQGEFTDVIPVYRDGSKYQPVRQDLATKLLEILAVHRDDPYGQISLECIQLAQQQAIALTQQSLATVERMSAIAHASTETTIAHLVKTNEQLANALATRSNASNVSVTIEQTESDRIVWLPLEWLMLFVGFFGMTMWMAIAASNALQPRPQYQPQSALPGDVQGYEPPSTIGCPKRTGGSGGRFV